MNTRSAYIYSLLTLLFGGVALGVALSPEDLKELQDRSFSEKGEYVQVKRGELDPNKKALPYDGTNGKGWLELTYSTTSVESATGTDYIIEVEVIDHGRAGKSQFCRGSICEKR